MSKRLTEILSEEEITLLTKLQGSEQFMLYWEELERKYANVLFPNFRQKGSSDNDPKDVA